MMMPEAQVTPGFCLAALLKGLAEASPLADEVAVTGLSQDAQSVAPGDLFLAVRGRRTHGLRYVDQALARGAAAVVWEPDSEIASPRVSKNIPVIALPELRQRLGLIADRFFNHPSRDLTVIGVTGTDGKTSVSHFLAQALDTPGKPCGLIGTLGYGLNGRLRLATHTTPDVIRLHAELAAMRSQGAKAAVMEVSSHALDQHRVNGVAMDVAVLTNLTRDHLDYHADVSAYAAAKRRLFELPGLRRAILNTDDAFGLELAQLLRAPLEVLGYSLGNPPLHALPMVRATRIESMLSGLRFEVQTSVGRGRVESRLLGRFNVNNLLAVLGVLLALGMPLRQALLRLGHTRGVPGRMEGHGGGDKPLVVVDYAHTPAALAQVLIALREHCRGRLRCVFGCGGDRDRGKRPLMARVAEQHADEAIVTDDNPRTEPPTTIIRDMLKGFSDPSRIAVIQDRARAIAHAVSRARGGDVVLVAGKGHEQVQIVGEQACPFNDSRVVESVLSEHQL
jgi:UDP-N-acetylmuramoyl-L-alanyl-D-glutamate--2,6-diaminopimelate ligase